MSKKTDKKTAQTAKKPVSTSKDSKKASQKPREWQVEWLDINSLTPYAKNARKNDQTVPYLINSIKRFGFKVPLVIDKRGVVVCGHTRLKAALECGLAKLPCVRADDLTDLEIKAFRLADNKIQEMSEWDDDILSTELDELKIDFDESMLDFGFTVDDDEEPDDLDGEEKDKSMVCKITFKSDADLKSFIEQYRTVLEEEFNATVSISGGEL